MRNDLERVRQELDRHLAYALRPGGEIDRKTRKEIEELLASQVTLEGVGLRARMPLHSWLTLVTKAHEVGWWPKGPFSLMEDSTVTADDARQLAAALAKVDLGEQLREATMAAQLLGLSGGFRLSVEAGQMEPGTQAVASAASPALDDERN